MLMADIFAPILFIKTKFILDVFIIKIIISTGFLTMIDIIEKLLKRFISNLNAVAVSTSDTLLSTCPNTYRRSSAYRNNETSFPHDIAVLMCNF